MSNHENPKKVPWPGIVALQKSCLYYNGFITDRSGFDAINEWGMTATQEEKEECHDWLILWAISRAWLSANLRLMSFGGGFSAEALDESLIVGTTYT